MCGESHTHSLEANGQYAKTNEVVEQLGRTFQRTGRRANDLDRGFMKASSGAGILTRSVGSLGGVLGALGIAAVTHEVERFGITSVQTAGRLDQLQRAHKYRGSSGAAQVRFESLVEVAISDYLRIIILYVIGIVLSHHQVF